MDPNETELIPYRNHLQVCLESYIEKYSHLHKHPHFNVYENINYQVYEPNDGYYEWTTLKTLIVDRVLVFMTYLTNTPSTVKQNLSIRTIKVNV